MRERRREGSIQPSNDLFTVRLRWNSTKWHQRSKSACVCTSVGLLSHDIVALVRKRRKLGFSCCVQCSDENRLQQQQRAEAV